MAQDAAALPWLAAPLATALAGARGHALLVHGTDGVGAFAFALAVAQARLCEDRPGPASSACGRCGSCRLVQARVHPDCFVLLPETLRLATGWLLRSDKPDDDGKRKPSRQIRIDDVRALIDWSSKTAARGRAKVAVVHPADALNVQAASALLKTLEEPPVGTRLVLTAGDPARLLPTVRSRCQVLRLAPPDAAVAAEWLSAQGVASPDVLLAACNGMPLDVAAFVASGIDAAGWAAVPRAVASGQGTPLAGWPLPRALQVLHQLCHDAMLRSVGAAVRYFPAGSFDRLPAAGLLPLLAWARELQRVSGHGEHPWNEPLLLDSLLAQGRRALALQSSDDDARALDTLTA